MKVQKITVFLLISLVACLPLVNAKNKIGLNEPFSIPSDPGATYKVLSVKKKSGKTEISSERQGKIYLSYVKREYDCNKNLVRYLAEPSGRRMAAP